MEFVQTSVTEFFITHLSKNAARYFEGCSGKQVQIKLELIKDLYSSSIYQFGVMTNGNYHSVVIKKSVGEIAAKRFAEIDINSPYPEGRPRVRPLPDPTIKFKYEYLALSAISDYFTKLDDTRFGSIRVLDVLKDKQAIIMERIRDTKLVSLFSKANRLQFPFKPKNLEIAFQNAGAWLKKFHQLPALEHTKKRHINRSDFIDSIFQLSNFLAHVKGKKSVYFTRVAAVVEAKANIILPEVLPLGIGHGDYAAHNIFVEANGRVIVFDTLANWQAPIYEDISHFLTVLKTNKLQVYTQGMAFSPFVIERQEGAFLRGYFGDKTIPYAVIKLFEIQIILAKWPWGRQNYKKDSKLKRIVRRSQLAAKELFLHRYLDRLIADVHKN